MHEKFAYAAVLLDFGELRSVENGLVGLSVDNVSDVALRKQLDKQETLCSTLKLAEDLSLEHHTGPFVEFV